MITITTTKSDGKVESISERTRDVIADIGFESMRLCASWPVQTYGALIKIHLRCLLYWRASVAPPADWRYQAGQSVRPNVAHFFREPHRRFGGPVCRIHSRVLEPTDDSLGLIIPKNDAIQEALGRQFRLFCNIDDESDRGHGSTSTARNLLRPSTAGAVVGCHGTDCRMGIWSISGLMLCPVSTSE